MFLWLSVSFIQPGIIYSKKKRQTKSQDNWMKRNEKIEYHSSQLITGRQRNAFLFTSGKTQGSMTVEAALALPIVIVFFTCIMSFFTLMNVELRIQKTMDETAGEFAKSYYVIENLDGIVADNGKIASIFCSVFTYETAKVRTLNKLKDISSLESYISGGFDGISFLGTMYDSNEHTITLHLEYELQIPFFKIFGFTFPISQTAYRHAWVGRSNYNETDQEYVYITETGNVYHKTLSCTHIKLSIQEIASSRINSQKNENGDSFEACQYCGSMEGDVMYITETGTHYHYNRNCSGLKRTVFSIPISQVGSKKACQRCGY